MSITAELFLLQAEDRKDRSNQGNVRRGPGEGDKFPPMSARGRFLSGLVTMAIALAGSATVGALPAAANSGTVQYVALGDSYATGQGAGSYLNSCRQTANGYPELLDSEKRIHLQANETCSGATTFDVAETQLSALNRGTKLVTLTVGGNDVNVAAVAAACSPTPSATCLDAINRAHAQLPVLGGHLTDLYALVAEAAPNALIVVTGYPYLFEQPAEGDPNAAIITQINDATTALNATIQQAVATTRATGVNIVYIDVTGSEEFGGHGIGSAEPFINSTGPDAFHPNIQGYLAYAEAISAKLPSAWLDEQEQST
jgi:lysophospholipase L1-like esterase